MGGDNIFLEGINLKPILLLKIPRLSLDQLRKRQNPFDLFSLAGWSTVVQPGVRSGAKVDGGAGRWVVGE